MKKYLDQVISLNVLVKTPHKNDDTNNRIKNLYEGMIKENAQMLEETKNFFQKDNVYYNFHDAQVLDIKQKNKQLELKTKVHAFESGYPSTQEVTLNIDLKMFKSLKLNRGDIIHTVAVHNNQLGLILKKDEHSTMFSEIIDFKNISIKNNTSREHKISMKR